ncbi:hypothetical protein HGO34_02080 [Agrobacterium vitis]|uniref:hypothetical protein n=1 Tax=Rhizobium/Agrobacterium group TaxID=227290 RepID=UPI001F2DF414|nr:MULTISPECIES: hypothetical protein [Rhizobium/Agrobacterium group]MCF1501709.1 hypothetical protein [Allorhizobium sp. Av2]MCM2438505.1 hypothetical protein [Agrobacterium vitis]MCM2473159.1 hypothetical protein [Rhizobium sp. CG5]
MSSYVLFQMWGPFRQSLIKGHLFYVEQARKRLLSQFDEIEVDADQAAEEWLEQSGQHFDPDRHDPGDFYEAANDVGIEFYGLLSGMREQTRLSAVAGMFHEWDKQLRDWLAREIQHWHRGDNATLKVWSADFGQIADLLESFGWNVRNADYFRTLDACRLVVNVYKHGEGKSLDELKSSFPEYLDDLFNGSGGAFSDTKYRDHTHLKVSDDQFQAFSDAILAFWRDVPENVIDSQMTDVPDWFGKAIMKDRADPQQASKK